MTEYVFSLHLSSDDYLHYYTGQASFVQVTADCGTVIRFPAERIRSFVSREGIHGHFKIRLDKNNRFISLTKITG